MSGQRVVVVGGGLAGCECAWQLASRGVDVVLVEQRPGDTTPAHRTGQLAELVCSNSLRGASVENAVGLLKEEMRRCASIVIAAADSVRVPAGGALAVDRERFASAMTRSMTHHPRIRVERRRIDRVPDDRPCVLATGPLTSDRLASDLAERLGTSSLAYYDAIAPIVDADTIDRGIVFEQSRHDKGAMDLEGDSAAYLNCPMDEAQYREFVAALREADRVTAREFEGVAYFEGCLPVEVMAERGEMTLAFGPMKPVGLVDPRTGRRPFAVVQLRREDRAGTAYNMVGFQTRLKHDAQRRVFRMIPGLEKASFLRLGSMHRNTFVCAPVVLDETLQLRVEPGVYLAGQITGVEGYVESAACGMLCGQMLADVMMGRPARRPPATTMLGGLMGHLRGGEGAFQPSNATWAMVPPVAGKKSQRKAERARRALADLDAWLASLPPAPSLPALA